MNMQILLSEDEYQILKAESQKVISCESDRKWCFQQLVDIRISLMK